MAARGITELLLCEAHTTHRSQSLDKHRRFHKAERSEAIPARTPDFLHIAFEREAQYSEVTFVGNGAWTDFLMGCAEAVIGASRDGLSTGAQTGSSTWLAGIGVIQNFVSLGKWGASGALAALTTAIS